jgi:DNA-directed RNA polymerase specialized sigma24 family protein
MGKSGAFDWENLRNPTSLLRCTTEAWYIQTERFITDDLSDPPACGRSCLQRHLETAELNLISSNNFQKMPKGFEMSRFEEKYAEIAEHLDISVKTVKLTCQRPCTY